MKRTDSYHRRRLGSAALVALCLLAAPATVLGQASDSSGVVTTEGVVVALESEDIVVDLAGKRGAAGGDVVEIWRPLKLKHPVTGKVVTDRFRIGSLKLTQVRDVLSLARVDGKLTRAAEPGDIVILRKAKLESTPTKPTLKTERPAAPDVPAVSFGAGAEPVDPDARFVSELFDRLKGTTVSQRIIAYEDYVRNNPEGRYAVVLWEEAAQLRRLLAHDSVGKGGRVPSLLNFKAPKEALQGVPLSLGVEVEGAAVGAVLHARRDGEVAYQPTPMRATGPGYFGVTIPAERMRAPGVSFFIEATTADGKAHPLVAGPDNPTKIEVVPIPQPTPPLRNEATASIWTDYADYNQMKGNDRVWQTEGFVGMRFGDEGLRALRTGFGVFRGVGGSLEELDELKLSGRRVGLTYGYLEAEGAFSSFTSLIGRVVIGLHDQGVAGGALAMVRIGNDKKTNLQLGGEVLGGVGLRGITQLELNAFERVPIMFRSEVTNQPAGSAASRDTVRPDDPDATPDTTSLGRGEIGGRAIVQVGYRITPELVVAARGSYQGRTIKHAGPGFGGAVTYSW